MGKYREFTNELDALLAKHEITTYIIGVLKDHNIGTSIKGKPKELLEILKELKRNWDYDSHI